MNGERVLEYAASKFNVARVFPCQKARKSDRRHVRRRRLLGLRVPAAAAKGIKVEGLFMKNWEEDDGEEYCTAAADLADAQAVCDKLGIELHPLTLPPNIGITSLSSSRKSTKPAARRTDILCNKEIKFKAFLEFAAEDLGADYIATGHYVRRADVDGKKASCCEDSTATKIRATSSTPLATSRLPRACSRWVNWKNRRCVRSPKSWI